MEKLDRRGKRSIISDFRKIVSDFEVIRDPINLTISVGEVVFTDPTLAARTITQRLSLVYQAKALTHFMTLAGSKVRQTPELDLERSFVWLQKGLISSEVTNNVIAAQEGQLLIKAHPSRINTDRTCRLKCGFAEETAQHILTLCPHWRTSLMVKRHNSVARNVYYTLCNKFGFESRQYNQCIEVVRSKGPIELYWDHPIITRMDVVHNRPDIVVIDNLHRTVTIVEVSISWYSGIV